MEFPCAFYQLRARSNRLGTVFRDEEAHRIFLTPPEALPPHSSTPLPVPTVSGPAGAEAIPQRSRRCAMFLVNGASKYRPGRRKCSPAIRLLPPARSPRARSCPRKGVRVQILTKRTGFADFLACREASGLNFPVPFVAGGRGVSGGERLFMAGRTPQRPAPRPTIRLAPFSVAAPVGERG
jgi:hypothetical protein